MDLQLKGKTAVVAAASKGMGRSIAEKLAEAGANLFLCSRDEKRIQEVAALLSEKYGVKAHGTSVDLQKGEDIDRWIKFIASNTKQIDALLCNAGGPPGGFFREISDDLWEENFQLTFMSVVRLIRGCYPYMRKEGGRIVTIASTSVKMPLQGMILSNSLRAGVVGLMKTLANEMGRDGILLNTIAPGRILTERLGYFHEQMAEQEQIPVEVLRSYDTRDIPLGRFGAPQEVANYAAFLLSPLNTYMTGSVLYVDGGMVNAH